MAPLFLALGAFRDAARVSGWGYPLLVFPVIHAGRLGGVVHLPGLGLGLVMASMAATAWMDHPGVRAWGRTRSEQRDLVRERALS